MNFLRDLFRWFFRGRTNDNPAENTARSQAPVENKPDKKSAQKPLDVVGTILAEARPDVFLKELQSITPLKKQFDKDQADLQKEVKRLTGWRKRA